MTSASARQKRKEFDKARYKRNKKKAIDLLGGCCKACGSADNLRFNRVDPKATRFNLTGRLTGYKWEETVKLLKQFELFCSPRQKKHVKLHADRFNHKGNAIDWFWSRVKISPGCWEWIGPKNKQGYGVTCFENKYYRAHRASYVLCEGEIPSDKPMVLHRCDNPSCVNPGHLWAGTALDNAADREKKGRGGGGQPGGELHPKAKLKAADVLEMRKLYAEGNITYREIGKMFGVATGTAGGAITKTTWKEL